MGATQACRFLAKNTQVCLAIFYRIKYTIRYVFIKKGLGSYHG